MSSMDTPRSFAWARSMSNSSHGVAALLEIIQHQVQGAEIGCVGAQEDRLPRNGNRVLDPVGLERNLLNLLDDRLGARDRCGIGHLDVDEQVALVLLGNEAGRRV